MTSNPSRTRAVVRGILIGLLALACLTYIWMSASMAIRHISDLRNPVLVDAALADLNRWACSEKQLDLGVPAGSQVFVNEADAHLFQRLSEIAVGRYQLVDVPGPHVYQIRLSTVIGSSRSRPCTGPLLLVKTP